MTVGVCGRFSACVAVLGGVPRGSVLGPLLFVHGLCQQSPAWVVNGIRMFADDTEVWRKITRIEDQESLQDDLNKLAAYTQIHGC